MAQAPETVKTLTQYLDEILGNQDLLAYYGEIMKLDREARYRDMFSEPITMDELKFNPVVYNNEPYQVPETIQEILNQYLDALNKLREDYLATGDEKYATLLLDLVPADVYWRYN